MRKIRFSFIFIIAIAFLCLFALAACDGKKQNKPDNPPVAHVCEHVCPECGKCLDKDCKDPVCAEKCQGHTPAAHVCGHVCPDCGKCMDANCKDPVCSEKCPGHAQAHVCGHKCPDCGKCMDANCTDPACSEKCPGHAQAHVCGHVCPDCGKCMDANCTDPVCSEKCPGHSEQPAELVVAGYQQAASFEEDTELTDEMLLEGITAVCGDKTYSVYVTDKQNVNAAVVGSYTFTFGVKDDQGAVVNDDEGSPVSFNRSVSITKRYYPTLGIMGNDMEFDLNTEITDEMLLQGLIISGTTTPEEFTLYVKDSEALDSTTDGTYTVTFGIKRGNKVCYTDANTEILLELEVEIVIPAPEINITFYCNDEETIPDAYVELGTSSLNAIKAAILAGITAKDEDFREYLVQIVDMSAVNANEAGTYEVTLGAYNGVEPLNDNLGNQFTAKRNVIVKSFVKLAAPASFVVSGFDNQAGWIRFDSVPEGAEEYTIKFVALGEPATAEAIYEETVSFEAGVIPHAAMGFVNLAEGNYTMYVKASGTGYLDSDFSAGYDISYTLYANFTPEDIANWSNADHGIPSLVNGVAKIETPVDGWGKARSDEFNINLSKTVVLALDINKVDNAYFSSMYIDDSDVSVIGDTRDNVPVMKNVKLTGYSGNQIVKLTVGPTGGGPAIYLNGVKLFSIEEYVKPVENVKLSAPTDLGVGGDGSSIQWTGDAKANNYSVVVTARGGSEKLIEVETNKVSVPVAQLPVGDYTITVKCLGEAPLTLDSDEASWDFTIKEYANYTAEQIGTTFDGTGWEGDSTVTYNSETGYAVINYDGHRGYGAVGNPAVTVDLAKKPVVVMEDVNVTGGWLARSFFGSSTIITMQNDTIGDVHFDYLYKRVWLNVDGHAIPGMGGTEANPSGTGTYRFLMGFVGGNSSRVTLKSMRIVYIQEYSEAGPEALEAPNGFGPAASGSEIGWSSSALSHAYEVYKYGTDEKVAEGTCEGSTYQAALLPAGQYTLKVKGLGDNVETLDSDFASYNFVVQDIANYTAADIANDTLFAVHDGNVSCEVVGGKAVITNNSDWGTWAPILGAEVDLADRPVVVIKGLTLQHECWLARGYAASQTIVMQNDTNGTWNNVDIVRKLWVNVDGNPISANTGDKDNPAGTCAYSFGIGVNGSGIVEVESIRIVVISAL